MFRVKVFCYLLFLINYCLRLRKRLTILFYMVNTLENTRICRKLGQKSMSMEVGLYMLIYNSIKIF